MSCFSARALSRRMSPLVEDTCIFSAWTSGNSMSPLVVEARKPPWAVSPILEDISPLMVFTVSVSMSPANPAGRYTST